MHYVIGDIHNDSKKLKNILNQIDISVDDELIVLGDVFDRGGMNPDPIGVYFMLSGIKGKLTWIRGNHEQYLAEYIRGYYSKSERKREEIYSYTYNSFDIMKQRITEVDLMNLADMILNLPLQKEVIVEGKRYLMAHAMTSFPKTKQLEDYYLIGNNDFDKFLLEGIDGYISMCGHTPTGNILRKKDESSKCIWINERKNVYMLDCGCGYESGRLACISLENGERYYSEYE